MQGKAQSWEGQSDENFGFQFNIEPMDEKESFVLNVWSQGINDGKKRPVWVWIHGGGFPVARLTNFHSLMDVQWPQKVIL